MPIVTEGPRLSFRDFELRDLQPLLQLDQEPEVTRYLARSPYNEQTASSFLRLSSAQQRHPSRASFELAAVTKQDGRLVGGCGLHIFSAENREGIFHFWFGREHWSKGFATETGRALFDFGFSRLGLHRIFATVDCENDRSARTFRKLGARQDGVLREHLLKDGRWRSSLVFSILEHEWTLAAAELG